MTKGVAAWKRYALCNVHESPGGCRGHAVEGSAPRSAVGFTSALAVKKRCQLVAPLYGPAVRCKLDLNKWRVVLRFCIRPLHGAIVLLAIMDIRAHPISF